MIKKKDILFYKIKWGGVNVSFSVTNVQKMVMNENRVKLSGGVNY
jgi:hypothetical protein